MHSPLYRYKWRGGLDTETEIMVSGQIGVLSRSMWGGGLYTERWWENGSDQLYRER